MGGGKLPPGPGEQSGNQAPPGHLLFDGFDYPGTLSQAGWQLTGDFQAALNPSTSGGKFAIGKRINTFEGGPYQDNNVGTITSPEFYLTSSRGPPRSRSQGTWCRSTPSSPQARRHRLV